jgi:cytoskeletal protein RodZ
MSFATNFRQAKREERQARIVMSVFWSVVTCSLVGVITLGMYIWQAESDAPKIAQVKQSAQVQSAQLQNRPKQTRHERCMMAKDLQVRLTNAAVSPHKALGLVPEGFSQAMEYGTKSECDRFVDK